MHFKSLLEIFEALKSDKSSAWNNCVKNHIKNLAIIEKDGAVFFAPINYVAHFRKNADRGKGAVRDGPEFNEIIDCLKEQSFQTTSRAKFQSSPEFLAYLEYYRSLPTDDSSKIETRKSKDMTFWVRKSIASLSLVAPKDLTHDHIINAMKAFSNGGRPDGYGTPLGWHVVHPDTKEPFPLKGVYGLATGLSCSHKKAPNDFKTNVAIPILNKLDFECVDLRDNLLDKKLQQDIERSRNDTPEARQERLRSAPRKPAKTMQAVVRFQRNPDVIAERLHMAQGKCENCKKPAPFHRKTNSAPFLEVHHVIPLADDGDDTVENTRALCPNCHRKAHFG